MKTHEIITNRIERDNYLSWHILDLVGVYRHARAAERLMQATLGRPAIDTFEGLSGIGFNPAQGERSGNWWAVKPLLYSNQTLEVSVVATEAGLRVTESYYDDSYDTGQTADIRTYSPDDNTSRMTRSQATHHLNKLARAFEHLPVVE